MSREDIVAVAARVFAVYLALHTLLYLGYMFSLPHRESSVEWLVPALLVASLLVAALLWFFPLTLARNLLPAMKESRSETSLGAEAALSVGIALVGVWFVMSSVRPLALATMTILLNRDYGNAVEVHDSGPFIAALVQLLLGVGLAFGSRGLRDLLWRARNRPPVAPTPLNASDGD